MHCIIGSGPAGVACAKALSSRGVEVLMLDAGLDLEPDRARVVSQMASVQPPAWRPEQIAKLKEGMAAGAKGIPLKLIFGSDYPYRETETHIPWQGRGVGVLPSLALGGFSTVWGAAMLPYRDADIDDWPVQNADLEKHYRAVAEFTGLVAEHDDLEDYFSLHGNNPRPLQLSRQAGLLLNSLNRHRARLRDRGWRFGRARLAVRGVDSPKGGGCVYCGLCMYGCPYSCIYNSADIVRELTGEKGFTYQRDVVVASLRENSGKVIVDGHHRRTRAPLTFEADRVYLAGGVIPTAQILLRSQGAYDHPLHLRDSQYYLFPMLLAPAHGRRANRTALHTEPVVHRNQPPRNQPAHRAFAGLYLQ